MTTSLTPNIRAKAIEASTSTYRIATGAQAGRKVVTPVFVYGCPRLLGKPARKRSFVARGDK